MTWYLIQDKEKIIKVIERLLLKQIEIEVLIQGQDTRYYSRFIEIVPGPHRGDTSEIDGEALELIIEKLVPKSGNSLIPKLPEVAIQFPAEEYLCRCQTKHAFMGRTTPHYGLIMSFPKFLELEETRREERISLGLPEFLCAVFQVKEGHGKDRIYELDVINWSAHGLALLVSEKDYN